MKTIKLKSNIILLIMVSIFSVSCTPTIENDGNQDQISNEAYQESLDNFNELKFLFENRKYDEADSLLDNMKSNLPYSRFTKHGKILEIYSYYERNKYNTAIKKADAFIKTHPIHERIDYVHYLRSISSYSSNNALYQNLSQIPKIIEVNRSKIRQTFNYFSELVQKYPKSSYMPDSITKIKHLRQVLADYEFNDAYRYFDEAKYQEVIKRIDYIVQNYPHAKIIPKALKLQAKSYRLVGQIDTAKSIELNLRRNYQK